jgi:nucleotide-binding universal stress UspA family protein
MKTILVPFDYSTMSEAAAEAAADVGAAMNGRLVLFYAHKTEHMRPVSVG